MRKLLSTVLIFVMSFPVLAAKDAEGASAPAPTVDMIYVVIFGIVFVGAIVGFLAYLFMKKDDSEQK